MNTFFSFGVPLLGKCPYFFHIELFKDHHFPVIVKLEMKRFSKLLQATPASKDGHHSHKSPFFKPQAEAYEKLGPTDPAKGQSMPLKTINSFPIITYAHVKDSTESPGSWCQMTTCEFLFQLWRFRGS